MPMPDPMGPQMVTCNRCGSIFPKPTDESEIQCPICVLKEKNASPKGQIENKFLERLTEFLTRRSDSDEIVNELNQFVQERWEWKAFYDPNRVIVRKVSSPEVNTQPIVTTNKPPLKVGIPLDKPPIKLVKKS